MKTNMPSQTNIARAALQSFFNISVLWNLSEEEERLLLGSPATHTFRKWKTDKTTINLDQDTIHRISYLLGIYKALHLLLPSTQAANAWIRKPNSELRFGGESAINLLLNGKLDQFLELWQYLDAQCNDYDIS